jgi:hypothetical protein
MTLQDSKQALVQLRQLWPKIKEALDGGIPLVLEIKRESKTRQQEKLYHQHIGKVATQARHLNCVYNEETGSESLSMPTCASLIKSLAS